MKKNLFSFYIILTVIGLTIIFLFPARGRAECDRQDPYGACTGDSGITIQPEESALENGVAGQATLISPWGQTFTATPTYTWTAVPNTTWYQIWINTSTGTLDHKWYTAAEVGCPSGTGNCSLTAPAALAPGTYTWWIQAWYNAYGPWSDGKPFYVDPNGQNCQNISALTFLPYSSGTTYEGSNSWRYRTGGSSLFTAAVHLPAGAQITQISADYYDNAAGDVALWLVDARPGEFSNYTSYGAAISSGTPGFGRLEFNLMPYNIIVDNAGHTYLIYVRLGDIGSNNSFLNAIICHKPSP